MERMTDRRKTESMRERRRRRGNAPWKGRRMMDRRGGTECKRTGKRDGEMKEYGDEGRVTKNKRNVRKEGKA